MNGENFTKHTLQILLSVGINYHVLREDYIVVKKPLLIVTGAGNMETVISILSDKDTPKLNEFLNFKETMQVLNSVNSDFVVYPYIQSKKGNGFLEIITSIVATGCTGDNGFNALPVVVAENIPYGYNTDHFFIISLDGCSGNILFDRFCVVPQEDELAVVFDKYSSYAADATNEEKALLAAASFLYPYFRDNNSGEEFQDLLKCAKKLVEFNEDSHNLNGVGDFFIDSLYRWQENTSFHNIYRLPELGMSVVRKTSQAVFFDDRYIYMKDSFFKQIASPLLNTFQVSVLKKALVDDGILCPDKSDTYTVKVGYYNIAGQFKRERMLRFSRNGLEKTGEPGFVEICLNSKQNRKKSNFARVHRGVTKKEAD